LLVGAAVGLAVAIACALHGHNRRCHPSTGL
jgi:hypothetical protein